jgi:hypothetical protein
MKKLILVLSFITGLSVMANAQITQKSPEQRAGHITKVLQKRLNLSPEQASQINAALLTQATRMDSLKSNRSVDKKANRLSARVIMLSTQKQVMAILDDTQKQKFIEWEKMRQEKHREKKDAILKS